MKTILCVDCIDATHNLNIVSVVANYFGDTSGMHYKNKRYVMAGDKICNQLPFGGAKEVKRITKELKGVLDEIRRQKDAEC